MIAAQSHRSRRVLGRLDRGSDLIEGIIDLCRTEKVRSGELRASGWLAEIELQDYDQQRRSLRTGRPLGTPVQLLSLTGTIAEQDGTLSVSAQALLSRETDNGIQVLGGQVLRAQVFSVEVIIDAFEDLILRRGTDQDTGVPAWIEIIELEPPPSPLAADAPLSIAAAPPPIAAAPRPIVAPPQRLAPQAPVALAAAEQPIIPHAVKEARLLAMKEAHLKGASVIAPKEARREDGAQRPPQIPPLDARGKALPPGHDEAELEDDLADALPRPSEPPVPAGPAGAARASDWEAVKAASEAREEDEAQDDDAKNPPKRGDLLEHATFGRCTIERVEENQERVSVRVRSGRLVQLSLEYLFLEPIGKEGGARLFKAVKRR